MFYNTFGDICVYICECMCVCLCVYTMILKYSKALLKRNIKMIDVMGNSFENLITLCKCKVIFYILMQISESVIGTHSK